jgi:uncharacterized membrane-anchored protein
MRAVWADVSSAKWRIFFYSLLITTLISTPAVRANVLSLQPLMAPTESVHWTAGPNKVSLPRLADIEIPAGYKFIDARGARAVLQQMKNPAPRGLIGIIAPNSGAWWVVLEFSEFGYVKESVEQADTAAVLAGLHSRLEQQGTVSSLAWATEPQFDAATHTLEWAVEAHAGQLGVVNHTLRVFGRYGMIDGTAVQSAEAGAEVAPLKDLMQGVSFKPGQRYEDFQEGDKVAAVGPVGSIVGELPVVGASAAADPFAAAQQPLAPTSQGLSASQDRIILMASAFLFFSAISVVLLRRLLARRRARSIRAVKPPAIPASLPRTNGAAVPVRKPELAVSRSAAANGVIRNGNGVANGNGNGHRNGFANTNGRRKRIFNYQKFYSDMVLQMSGVGAGGPDFRFKGRANGNGNANGNTNGNGNGHGDHSNGNGNGHSARVAGEQVTPGMTDAHFELIANQKNLIEEQQRLIQEQTRLIEEKTRLIKEKNHLLERQSELLERDLL